GRELWGDPTAGQVWIVGRVDSHDSALWAQPGASPLAKNHTGPTSRAVLRSRFGSMALLRAPVVRIRGARAGSSTDRISDAPVSDDHMYGSATARALRAQLRARR